MEIYESVNELKRLVTEYNAEVVIFNADIDVHNKLIKNKISSLLDSGENFLSKKVLELGKEKQNKASIIKLIPFSLIDIKYTTEDKFREDTEKLFNEEYRICKEKKELLESTESTKKKMTIGVLDNALVELYILLCKDRTIDNDKTYNVPSVMPMVSKYQFDERILKRLENKNDKTK